MFAISEQDCSLYFFPRTLVKLNENAKKIRNKNNGKFIGWKVLCAFIGDPLKIPCRAASHLIN